MAIEMHAHVDEAQDAASPDEVIEAMRREILDGSPWYAALLRAVGRWRLPAEQVGDRRYVYLIGGEAFDWLLLAERLTDAAPDLIPMDEREALLFTARPPDEVDEDEFRRLIGPAKHRAHLNFLYGVVVEEALQLSVEEDLHKEVRCAAWTIRPQVDEVVFERVYGQGKAALLYAFREERGLPHTPVIALTELREFTYWLFKMRVKAADPARVASDTRRGLAQLSRLESCRRRPAPAPGSQPEPAIIDL